MTLVREQIDTMFEELTGEIKDDMVEATFHAWVAKVMAFFTMTIGLNNPFCTNIDILYKDYSGDQRNIIAIFLAAKSFWQKGFFVDLLKEADKEAIARLIKIQGPNYQEDLVSPTNKRKKK